jgi:anti-sigma regulatory factor (Ser/Thr protein kinase)/GNAT superfamily N-acetyltransferase
VPSPLQPRLTIPADPRLLPLVQDFLRRVTGLADIPEDQAAPLITAVAEACRDCIASASDDEDDGGTLTLAAEITPAALHLAICDQGLPFDQTLESDDLPDPASPARRGRGIALIHACADEVSWLNHGPAGQEVRLTKYLAGSCRLEPAPPHNHQAVSQEAPQDYDIRTLRREDAIRVAQLMYRVYGYSYSNEDFYFPDRLEHDLETGRHVGVVAVAGRGEIVGHVGVERPDLGPLAELGQLAVAPAHRGQGLRKLMGDRLQEEIQRLGLTGLFAEAVTLHTISQEGSEGRGLAVCGVKLLNWQARFKRPDTIYHRTDSQASNHESTAQRETMVFYFKYLARAAPARICAPSRHRDVLAKIYRNLAVPVEFLEPSGPSGQGQLAVHFDQATGTGVIQVNRIGIDTLPEIIQAHRDLRDIAGAAVVCLNLPLAQGGTPYLCDAVEADGFFFAGVWPHLTPAGDCLGLQCLNAGLAPPDIHLFSPFAQELLAYILKEQARVQQIPGFASPQS